MCKNTIPESTWLRNLEKGKLCCLIWQRLICTENDYLDSWQVITDEWSFICTPNGIHVYKHHSADWNSTRKDSSEEFRRFNMLVKRNHQSLQWSNSNSNSVDSSYFRRIAYRGLCSQTPCVKDTHSIIAMSRSGWIQESNSLVDSRTPRGDTTPGIPGSRPDFDRTHGRNTHLRSHKRRLQCVWLPHGSLKASLGHTELK